MIDRDGIEKNLKEITGISISQLRALALQRPLGDTVTRGQSNAPQSSVAPPPPPHIEVTDQTIESKPIRQDSGRTITGDTGAGSGASHTFIIVENGIAYYAQWNASIGNAVT